MTNKPLTVGALIAQLSELDPAHKITAWYDGERRFFHHDIDASLTEDGIIELNCDYEEGMKIPHYPINGGDGNG